MMWLSAARIVAAAEHCFSRSMLDTRLSKLLSLVLTEDKVLRTTCLQQASAQGFIENMMSTALLLCFLGTAFAAPTPQQQGATEPASIEILVPYGFPGQAFGLPQPPLSNHPSSPAQNPLHGHTGPVSIEFLYPYGYPGQTFGNPQQPTSIFPSHGFIKPNGRWSNEVHGNPQSPPDQNPQQQGPAGPTSIEILVPYGYPGHTFGLPQQTQQNPSAPGSQTPQQQGPTGPVSIEILYPYRYPGHPLGHPQQTVSKTNPAAPQTPQQQGPTGAGSIEILVPYGYPGSLGHPQQTGSIFPSQGFIKHKVPQPAGQRSVEILYPFGFGHQQPKFPFGNMPPAMPQQPSQQDTNVDPSVGMLQESAQPGRPHEDAQAEQED
ncbi:collagen alpha-1(IV) chain-like isoform X1 [Polyodon spathula]|uniref:collagen alpha-1(IV) chain-like isoform X1 n=1 Tax=Polyodon spathula TaxID=7913 RepID=UPI001B7E2DB0|nr:collagen alpha-1(IV) chain-like isoform X1 [Polyodon spathula]